jgi:glyoxylase-like metal-dependent hydrolase (beta-lactamase superfamily II)
VLIDGSALWLAGTNCWVLAPERGGPAVIVDAPPDAAGVVELLSRHDLTPVALLATHGHADHIGGAGNITTRFAVSAISTLTTIGWRGSGRAATMPWGMVPPGDFARPERWEQLHHGQVLELAGLSLEVIHTPGHTPGHCCFHLPAAGVLCSGDQLFAGSIGRTDLPGGDFGALMKSMGERVLTLPPDTTVLPGHGPTTTLARERQSNPFLEAFRT